LDLKWKAVLLGGLIIGLAPFIPVLNLACCLYPIIGGIVAVAVYRGGAPAPLTNSDGISLGALTAVAGTAIYAILVVPVTMLVGSVVGGFLRSQTPSFSDVPDNVRPLLEWIFSHIGAAVGMIVFFKVLGQLAVSLIFGILGGVLGVALYKNRPMPSPPAPPPPPAL
jgi:hypothetical protein